MIQIKPRIIDAIYRHALSVYPSECCGIVIGKKGDPQSFEQTFPCSNLQDEMHTRDPQCFPRTSQTAYFLDPKELLKIQRIARNLTMEMRIIYHSHVDVGAYFSEEDKKRATYDGNPLYPGVMYLVVDVTKDKTRGAKCFGWSTEEKDFAELEWSQA